MNILLKIDDIKLVLSPSSPEGDAFIIFLISKNPLSKKVSNYICKFFKYLVINLSRYRIINNNSLSHFVNKKNSIIKGINVRIGIKLTHDEHRFKINYETISSYEQRLNYIIVYGKIIEMSEHNESIDDYYLKNNFYIKEKLIDNEDDKYNLLSIGGYKWMKYIENKKKYIKDRNTLFKNKIYSESKKTIIFVEYKDLDKVKRNKKINLFKIKRDNTYIYNYNSNEITSVVKFLLNDDNVEYFSIGYISVYNMKPFILSECKMYDHFGPGMNFIARGIQLFTEDKLKNFKIKYQLKKNAKGIIYNNNVRINTNKLDPQYIKAKKKDLKVGKNGNINLIAV